MVSKQESESIRLQPYTEYCFEVLGVKKIIELKLVEGDAAIFGTSLTTDKTYKFVTGENVPIYTRYGCKIKFNGREPEKSKRTVDSTKLIWYVNFDECLKNNRRIAATTNTRGPRVMIVGSIDAGKSAFCKTLLSYSASSTDNNPAKPVYVDVDVGGGHTFIPGTMGAAVINEPYAIGDGFCLKDALTYNYGHMDVDHNPIYYEMLISLLAENVLKRMMSEPIVNYSGMIIDTFPWFEKSGHKMLLHIAQSFQVDYIFVLGEENLFSQLSRNVPSSMKIVSCPKNDGVVIKPLTTRPDRQEMIARRYFYGTPNAPLVPRTFELKYSDVKLVRVGPIVPLWCIINAVSEEKKKFIEVAFIQPELKFVRHLLGVSSAKKIDEVALSKIDGYVWIMKMNVRERTLQILSPECWSSLTDKFLVFSEAFYMDIFRYNTDRFY